MEPHIVSSEREFLSLKGDFCESVKLTCSPHEPHISNGWYVYERTSLGKHMFYRKRAESKLIEAVTCDTKYLQFDRNLGILPNAHYVDFYPVGIGNPEFEELKKRLTSVQEYR